MPRDHITKTELDALLQLAREEQAAHLAVYLRGDGYNYDELATAATMKFQDAYQSTISRLRSPAGRS